MAAGNISDGSNMTLIEYITIHPTALLDVRGEYIIRLYLISPPVKYGLKIVDLSRFDPINFYLLPLLKMRNSYSGFIQQEVKEKLGWLTGDCIFITVESNPTEFSLTGFDKKIDKINKH
jgi:hypothetical protein